MNAHQRALSIIKDAEEADQRVVHWIFSEQIKGYVFNQSVGQRTKDDGFCGIRVIYREDQPPDLVTGVLTNGTHTAFRIGLAAHLDYMTVGAQPAHPDIDLDEEEPSNDDQSHSRDDETLGQESGIPGFTDQG